MFSEEAKQLSVLLDNGLSANQAARENSEKILLQSAQTNPSVMIELLLDILRSRIRT